MFTKITVPLDGSKLAEQVVPYAVQIARSFGAEVRLVCALEQPEKKKSPTPKSEDAAEVYLETIASKLVPNPKVSTTVAKGDAATVITAQAKSFHSDLIAMATHGRSGMKRWTMGSVADRVLRKSVQSVLIIRPKDEAASSVKPIQRIVLPLDGSAVAEQAIPYAQALALSMGLPIQIVRILSFTGAYGISGTVTDYSNPSVMDATMEREIKKEAEKYVDFVAQKLNKRKISTTEHVAWGDPASAILGAAEKSGSSIVVMTTHGRGGVGKWVLGSVADRVVRQGSQPVLIVHAHKKK